MTHTFRARTALVAACLAAAGGLFDLSCRKGGRGAGTGPAAGKPATRAAGIVVGFSQIGAESAWRTAETESVRSEAARRAIELRLADGQQKQENQIKAVRAFIAQGVSAIVLAPVVETGWEPVLREAKRAGIPVVLADRGISTSDASLYATLVSPDVVEEGRMAGRWLAKRLGGKGNVVELLGTPGSSPAIDRADGFRQIIAQSSDIHLVRSQSGDFTRAKGKEVMEAFLKADVRIDAVYAHNDDMALGAIQAIEETGKKPGRDIVVVSIDAVRGAFEAMVAGKLNCTVECNPLLGPPIFDAIESLLAGKPVPRKISLQERLFEQHEAKDLIGERKY